MIHVQMMTVMAETLNKMLFAFEPYERLIAAMKETFLEEILLDEKAVRVTSRLATENG